MATVIWLILIIAGPSYGLKSSVPYEYNGYCMNMYCNSMKNLKKLENCTIVLGDLKLLLMERTKPKDFVNITFPKLKEVTGFIIVYRVAGLESFGKLFPNLARIRGTNLLYNYALIVYDMPNLREIGFFNLVKIDRGGVIIWGGPLTCYVDTINWSLIAPKARHVLSSADRHTNCNSKCSCSRYSATNHCWNNKKCQRYLEGIEGEICSSKCIGCRKTNASSCSLCKEFTYGDSCVSKCPNETMVLSVSNYCVTGAECQRLNHWPWEGKCVMTCPENYVKKNESGTITCVHCVYCNKTCGNLTLHTLASIQEAEKCVYINGSLTIHVGSIPGVERELKFYLKNIVEVSDYILIFSSLIITSLHFLSSLQRVRGLHLYNEKYSLVINDMHNLQAIFLANVTENLIVERGTLGLYRNPMLCMKQIEKLKSLFPVLPTEQDIPQGMNSYSGSCKEVSLDLKIRVTNETSAVATFYTQTKLDFHYTILYVRIPHGVNATIVPETCSEFEWHAISIPITPKGLAEVEILNLQPASSYAACIETYEPTSNYVARSAIVHFTTPVGKPEPPFILELIASLSDAIVIRWVDHIDFKPFIHHYELDINIINVFDVGVIYKDNCLSPDNNMLQIDYARHAKVMRPPSRYEKSCESMCGILSTMAHGAMVEDYFDVCSALNGCGHNEFIKRPKNITEGGIVKSLSFDLYGSANSYQISGLAPFRDYRFELRACTVNSCSRTVREFVRTLRTKNADMATIVHASASYGYVTVHWNPPKHSNGPVLCYNIEIYPNIKINDWSRTLPQVTCVGRNATSMVVKTLKANKYLVKLCTTTLGSSYMCTEMKKLEVHKEMETKSSYTWIGGIIFGVLIYIISILFGCKFRHREIRTEDVPLVDATSEHRNETEAPAVMVSDFMPLYKIPYRESRL